MYPACGVGSLVSGDRGCPLPVREVSCAKAPSAKEKAEKADTATTNFVIEFSRFVCIGVGSERFAARGATAVSRPIPYAEHDERKVTVERTGRSSRTHPPDTPQRLNRVERSANFSQRSKALHHLNRAALHSRSRAKARSVSTQASTI